MESPAFSLKPLNELNRDFFANHAQVAAITPSAQTSTLGGEMKATELFVIVALILLVFALIARFISPSGLGMSIAWRGTGYVLPPSFICIAMATMLCFFASIYSLWMLPFNRTATWWHFSLTTIGIGVFWLAFYRVPNSRAAVWAAFAAPAAILLTQVIFVWNFIQAIFRMPRLHG
jgi:hypothetical protein